MKHANEWILLAGVVSSESLAKLKVEVPSVHRQTVSTGKQVAS